MNKELDVPHWAMPAVKYWREQANLSEIVTDRAIYAALVNQGSVPQTEQYTVNLLTRLNPEVTQGPINAQYLYFKTTGKYYTSGEGHLPKELFSSRPLKPHEKQQIIAINNGGKLPGLDGPTTDLTIVISGNEGIDYGWPVLIKREQCS